MMMMMMMMMIIYIRDRVIKVVALDSLGRLPLTDVGSNHPTSDIRFITRERYLAGSWNIDLLRSSLVPEIIFSMAHEAYINQRKL